MPRAIGQPDHNISLKTTVNNMFIHMMGSTRFPVTVPLTWLGIGLNNQNWSFNVPNSILWIGGLSCAYHLFKQLGVLKENVVTWIKSFWNAKKYLQPTSDKYPSGAQEALNRGAPSSGPGIRDEV